MIALVVASKVLVRYAHPVLLMFYGASSKGYCAHLLTVPFFPFQVCRHSEVLANTD